MDTFSEQRFRETLAETVWDVLARGEAVVWPDLGTFRVEHRAGTMEQRPDGTVVMEPPREEVVFKADAS